MTRRVPWLGERISALAIRRNLAQVMQLNGSKRGETVFIIGSGPQLNSLSADQLRALNSRPTIGVNRTQYALDLEFFLSAYPAEVLLARARGSARTTVMHLRPRLEAPLIRNTLTIRRVRHAKGQPLAPTLTEPEPTLHTFKNVALAATHLALVLGAKRVIFVGVEQTSALHFYDTRPELRRQMITDIKKIRAQSILSIDHPYATAEHLLEKLATDAEDLASRSFYVESHAGSFREFFDELERHGTEVFATTGDSVVAHAGAAVVDLDKALAW